MSVELHGTARVLADALGERLPVDDIYASGAGLYDALTRSDTSELAQMIAATRHLRGDVLDLGCGSGRLTLPFLARGRRVVALDLSEPMVAVLRAKAATLPPRLGERLETVVGDMAALDLGRRFDAILLGTTSITLLSDDDRSRTLAAVRAHLTDAGRFLVSTLDVTADAAGAEHVHVAPVRGDDGAYAVATLIEELDLERELRRVTILEQALDGAGLRLFHSAPRLLSEARLSAELDAAGLDVVERWVLSEPHPGQRVVLLACGRTA